MKNRYEFKIEEINEVRIVTVSDPLKYTILCKRELKEGTPLRTFKETYSAHPDYNEELGIVGIICPKCGDWNYFDKSIYDNVSSFECDNEDCDDNYCDENSIINLVHSIINESFNEIELYINGIHIV